MTGMSDTTGTATEGGVWRTSGSSRRRLVVLALMAVAFAAACTSNNADISTDTTAGPAATSAPGTTQADDDVDDVGTTATSRGTTSTSSKGRGSSTTTKRRYTTETSTSTTHKSTGTTLDVDTPPEAEAFCARAFEVKQQFDSSPQSDAEQDAFAKEVATAFAELTALAPAEIEADMKRVNDVFQSATSFKDLMQAFEGGALDDATDHIDEYMLANCGFKL